jgi:hypothetical protein
MICGHLPSVRYNHCHATEIHPKKCRGREAGGRACVTQARAVYQRAAGLGLWHDTMTLGRVCITQLHMQPGAVEFLDPTGGAVEARRRSGGVAAVLTELGPVPHYTT